MITCPEYDKLTYDFYGLLMVRNIKESIPKSKSITEHFNKCKECLEECGIFNILRKITYDLEFNQMLPNDIYKHLENCDDCKGILTKHIRTQKAKPKKETSK